MKADLDIGLNVIALQPYRQITYSVTKSCLQII